MKSIVPTPAISSYNRFQSFDINIKGSIFQITVQKLDSGYYEIWQGKNKHGIIYLEKENGLSEWKSSDLFASGVLEQIGIQLSRFNNQGYQAI